MSASSYHGVYDPYALGFKPASSGSFEVKSACLEREAVAVAAPDERRGSIVKALQRSWLFASCWRAERWQHDASPSSFWAQEAQRTGAQRS
jgi:hypothetical protein